MAESSEPTETATVTTPAERPPRKRGRLWLEAAIIVIAFFAIRAYQTRDLVAGSVPELPRTSIDGTALPEHPRVVHFFASWCGVCEAESGNVATLAEHHEVLAIASQSGESAEVRSYLAGHGLGPASIALDPRGELAQRFGVHAFPATFYLDDEGHIVTSEVGYTTTAGMLLRAWWAD